MLNFEISFSGAEDSEANLLAQDLEAILRDTLPEQAVQRRKSTANTQDFGGTLVLVLGTPVAAIVAKSIADFLKRKSGARITIRRNGDVVAENLDSRDAARIAEAFSVKL